MDKYYLLEPFYNVLQNVIKCILLDFGAFCNTRSRASQRRVDREDRKWEELSIEKWSGVERSGVERARVGGHERIDEREVDRIGQERRGEERRGEGRS